jgi:hypothetical protein
MSYIWCKQHRPNGRDDCLTCRDAAECDNAMDALELANSSLRAEIAALRAERDEARAYSERLKMQLDERVEWLKVYGAERDRYRAALEWCADKQNWCRHPDEIVTRARAALAGVSETD